MTTKFALRFLTNTLFFCNLRMFASKKSLNTRLKEGPSDWRYEINSGLQLSKGYSSLSIRLFVIGWWWFWYEFPEKIVKHHLQEVVIAVLMRLTSILSVVLHPSQVPLNKMFADHICDQKLLNWISTRILLQIPILYLESNQPCRQRNFHFLQKSYSLFVSEIPAIYLAARQQFVS